MQLNELTHECQWRFRYRPNDPDVRPSLSSSVMEKKTKYVFLKKESGNIYILIWDLFHRFI